MAEGNQISRFRNTQTSLSRIALVSATHLQHGKTTHFVRWENPFFGISTNSCLTVFSKTLLRQQGVGSRIRS